jgi:hypothetical protein
VHLAGSQRNLELNEGKWISLMKTPYSFVMSVATYQSVRHDISEYLNLHHGCEGLKSCSIWVLLCNKIVVSL